MSELLEGWRDFNVAMVGAAAALAGLVIVAASVNIADIVKEKSITARLAAGIFGLVLALSASAIGLVPDISGVGYGGAVAALALIAIVFQAQATYRIFQNKDPVHRLRGARSAVGFAAPVAYGVGAVLLLAGAGAGLVWFAAGSLLAITSALFVSWIVLVEVLR